jgi:hypothetical protein
MVGLTLFPEYKAHFDTPPRITSVKLLQHLLSMDVTHYDNGVLFLASPGVVFCFVSGSFFPAPLLVIAP